MNILTFKYGVVFSFNVWSLIAFVIIPSIRYGVVSLIMCYCMVFVYILSFKYGVVSLIMCGLELRL